MVTLSPEPVWLAVLGFIFLVWTKRALWMARFRKTHPPLAPVSFTLPAPPLVSVIVPARNEEKNIENCLTHLLKQTYPRLEIIVVDDRSTDRTPQLIGSFQRTSKTPVKNVRIEKLPPGWTGKNYAMFTGSKAAEGEWFLFTDADTTHRAESLSTALGCALERKIDFLTLAPETESKSFWEKTVQPLAVGSLALWFNPEKINAPNSEVTLANGQFILVRRDVYEKTGGNEAVRQEVVEDVEQAKRARSAGYLVQFLDGTRLYSTRMYGSLKEIRAGWTRILTYLFNKNVWAILHKIFLFALFSCLPYFVLFFEIWAKFVRPEIFSAGLFGAGLGVCFWITAIRFQGNRAVKVNPWYAVLHLLGSFVMIGILLNCVARIVLKRRSVWKGQSYA
ncbi:MAG: glycosyltransferase [Candidatus Omnitrophota bacterium]